MFCDIYFENFGDQKGKKVFNQSVLYRAYLISFLPATLIMKPYIQTKP